MTTQTTTRANWPAAVYSARTAHTAIRLYSGAPRLRRLAMAIRIVCRTDAPHIDPSTIAMPDDVTAERYERILSRWTPSQIRSLITDPERHWGLSATHPLTATVLRWVSNAVRGGE